MQLDNKAQNSKIVRFFATLRILYLQDTSCLRGMRDRSMRSGTELAREIQLTDWSTAGDLSNRSSGVQIPRDICTRFGRCLYSTKSSWIIKHKILKSYDFSPL